MAVSQLCTGGHNRVSSNILAVEPHERWSSYENHPFFPVSGDFKISFLSSQSVFTFLFLEELI